VLEKFGHPAQYSPKSLWKKYSPRAALFSRRCDGTDIYSHQISKLSKSGFWNKKVFSWHTRGPLHSGVMRFVLVGLGAAAVYVLRRMRPRVPFTGRSHFVLVPAALERLLAINALDGEAEHLYAIGTLPSGGAHVRPHAGSNTLPGDDLFVFRVQHSCARISLATGPPAPNPLSKHFRLPRS